MPSLWSSKSNRSHNSVDTSSERPLPVPSGPGSEQAGNRIPVQEGVPTEAQGQRPPPVQQQQRFSQQIPSGGPPAVYAEHYPQRVASNRQSANLSLDQQKLQQQYQGVPQQSPPYDQPRRGSQQPPAQPFVAQETKKSLRSRLPWSSSHKEEDTKQAANNKVKRQSSVLKEETRARELQVQEENRLQAAQWSQRQRSNQHLPPSQEQDEKDRLDPFLQQENPNAQPQVPLKDPQFQVQPPAYQQSPHQEAYNRPPLAKVDTQGAHPTQGGVDGYSPEHQQGLQQVVPQQSQQQYQSYQPTGPPHNPNTNDYQAFNPHSAPSPLAGNPQTPQDQLQQQAYFQYQTQQTQQTQQQAQLQAQQGSPQSVQDPQVQNLRYPQPPSFPQQAQPYQNQDFQHIQQGQPSSQAQGDINSPLVSRQIPHITQEGQPVNSKHQQQFRPPSSQAHFAPPSPLQSQGGNFQAFDPQQSQSGQHNQVTDPHMQNVTPPQQPGQDNSMPQSSSSQRNATRKVKDVGQPPPGAPSREGSLLQSTAQGQKIQGQTPVTPGISSFGANVVPTASQGQPFRGDKQNRQPQVQEMGRATPPPKAGLDLSDEEIAQLIKDHDILREKYQKVKRYFFEQQTQVHQLQNTLANQRLSLSRTSWDDSEYATRFTRLDGLIAQLSFAIRKDWKEIPPWLHVVVNKNAVETGKQEMTAVGRAFISYWLVENIFDKYFHPDLETGLSTQLKAVQLNIRKYAPTSHSNEDEDALTAKVVNWRLATLEGLADLLRGPQAATNSAALIAKLNEQLVGSLQMYLNDPAPPDLTGGVPMIVELAITVAQHLPLESREVIIDYFHPGHPLVPELMKVESGIPTLTNPILEHDEGDRASVRSVTSKLEDTASIAEPDPQAQQPQGAPAPKDKKHGFFGGLGGTKKASTPSAPLSSQRDGSSLGQGESQQSLAQPQPQSTGPPKDEQTASRVRFAVGVAIQIRGRSVLTKAPVYST